MRLRALRLVLWEDEDALSVEWPTNVAVERQPLAKLNRYPCHGRIDLAQQMAPLQWVFFFWCTHARLF